MGEDHLYRRGAGIMLVNREGKLFVAARNDNEADAWQMPQGGLDEGEEAWAGILRELEEETGIAPDLVEKIAEHPQLLRYELPEEWRGRLWGGEWIGQEQNWFLARFLGSDSDIDLDTDHPEFRDWKWVEPGQVPELIVPFKRDLYRQLIADFAEFL